MAKVTIIDGGRKPLPKLLDIATGMPVDQRINVDLFEASKANVPSNVDYFQNQLGMIMRALGH